MQPAKSGWIPKNAVQGAGALFDRVKIASAKPMCMDAIANAEKHGKKNWRKGYSEVWYITAGTEHC